MSLVVYLKHCGDDDVFYVHKLASKKINAAVQHQIEGTGIAKQKGVGIRMQICFLHSVTPMYDFPQMKHLSPQQLSWFAICSSAPSCHHIY